MTSHQRVVLWVAILASFVAFLDGSIVNVALPAIAADLGGGLVIQQWVLDGYLLTLGSLILVAGALSDMYGRVRVLRAGLVLFGAASLLCAVAPTGPVLVAARLLQGAAAALLVPSSLALITSTFEEEPRARAIGLWTGWTGTAFIVGPVLGGVLVDTIGWRWVFGINVVPIAATMALLAEAARPGARDRGCARRFPGRAAGGARPGGNRLCADHAGHAGLGQPAGAGPLRGGAGVPGRASSGGRRAPRTR